MNVGRRGFIRTMATASLLLMSTGWMALMTGCNVFTDILDWVPVGLAAFQSIITLLEAAGVINMSAGGSIAALVGEIETGFGDLKLAIQQYESTNPPPAGTLAQIDAILAAIVTNFQNLLSLLPIPDQSLAQLILGLAQIILSTIAGFQALLPASAAAATGDFMVGTQPINIVPVHRTKGKFISDWNETAEGGGHPEIDL